MPVVGPLIVWLIKRDQDPFIDENGKEAVNFQLTMFIAMMVSVALVFIAIGIILLPAIALFNIIMTIINGIKAANGEMPRYPLTYRFLK